MLGRLSSIFHIILIVSLGLLAYSNTFNAGFLWDEKYFIAQNPAVKDLSYFLDISKAKDSEYYDAIKNRCVGYLTFAINYRLHGLDLRGYHVFNFAIHILNALLVYCLVMLTLRTPLLAGSSLTGRSGYVALLTALIFISHPVQTEAVTYIFQRLASLMAFFYLLSLVSYAKWRLAGRRKYDARDEGHISGFIAFWRDNFFYILSLIAAILAMKTKENSFTLPLVIALYEFMFFRGPLKGRIWPLLPALLTLLIIPLSVAGLGAGGGGPFSKLVFDPDYLFTEFRVIVTYVRLLFLPIEQNIDYDYPQYHSLFEPGVFLSFLFYLAVLGIAVYLYFRSRFKSPASRLIAFGIFWFFITLAVESSFIRLPMVIDEYRLYLPSAGVFMAVTAGAFVFFLKIKGRRTQLAVIGAALLIPVVLTAASHARNSLWRDEITLWKDAMQKSPGKPRAHFNLGFAYAAKGRLDEAIGQYETALRLAPDYTDALLNLGFAYFMKGSPEKAIEHYNAAVKLEPDNAKLHLNLALAYKSLNRDEEAEAHMKRARELNPDIFATIP